MCSFCTESSKLTAERVAFVILSYDEGGLAIAARCNQLNGLLIHCKHCYIANRRRIFCHSSFL